MTGLELLDQLEDNGCEMLELVYPNYIYQQPHKHLAKVVGWRLTEDEKVELIIDVKEELT